ncbi:MAG: inositol monophosphatase family protein, partial [Pseudohongiellaceae bacterium]
MTYNSRLEFCKGIAREAGALIVRERNSGMQRDYKQGLELVTSADLKADKLIADAIHARYPEQLLISEELAPKMAQQDLSSRACWIVDPIDGTVNFVHGHNQSAVSIAYAEAGEIRIGVVYNPFTDEMFWASQGSGAWLNRQRIQVAQETQLNKAIIATGFPYQKSGLKPLIARLQAVLTHCADIRRLGAASLDICWVAMGRLDGYYENLSLWDFAAAQLIAREAGAIYGHFQPVPEGLSGVFYGQNILVANPTLYPQLESLLQAAD